MIESTTHIAESAGGTLCGLGLPPVNGKIPVGAGTRVGLTIGRVTYSCYVTGQNDTNDSCVVCAALWAEQASSHEAVTTPGQGVVGGSDLSRRSEAQPDSGFDCPHGI